jgi:hypothetical protein
MARTRSRAVAGAAVLALTLSLGVAMAAEDVPPPLPPAGGAETPPPLPQAKYYADEAGRPAGPFTLEELKARIQANQTGRTRLVWKSGLPDWLPAEEFAEIRPAFEAPGSAGAHEPPPPPPGADWSRYLLGTWLANLTDSQGFNWEVRSTYTADGKYSGYEAAGLETLAYVPASGTWSVSGIDETRFILVLKPTGQRQLISVPFTRLDADTIQSDQHGYVARRIE